MTESICDVRWEPDPLSKTQEEDMQRWLEPLQSMPADEFSRLAHMDVGKALEMPEAARPPLWMIFDEIHRRGMCSCGPQKSVNERN